MLADVAVVLSTISVDEWLHEAIKSVLSERSVRIELIIVLDGLPAEQASGVARTWSLDDRVTCVPLQQRGGLAAALREGIASSSAPLIARLDADDVSLPGRFDRQKRYLDANPTAVVVGSGAYLIDETGREVGFNAPEFGPDVRRRLVRRNQIMHPSVMFRRSTYEMTSGYNARLTRMQDYDLWLRMALHGPIAVLDERLIRYRVHPSQASRSAKPTGDHVSAIVRGQRELASMLGTPTAIALVESNVWRAAQHLRYWGVVRPGYDRMLYARRHSITSEGFVS